MQYQSQPKKEFKTVMDYKNQNISKFQDEKQEGMRLMSSGRDAVIMVSTLHPKLTDEKAKEKILEWRKWFYVNIYGKNEEFYQQNNKPF